MSFLKFPRRSTPCCALAPLAGGHGRRLYYSSGDSDLESLARHKNEEGAKSSVDEDSHHCNHDSASDEKLADVCLSHAGEIKRRVLAQPSKREDRIQRILIRGKAVYSKCERDNELSDESVCGQL